MDNPEDIRDEAINKSFITYANLLKYDQLEPSEDDKFDIITITSKISDLFNNNTVDYIVSPVKIKSNKIIVNPDKFRYIRNLTIETLSCNRYSINFLCDMCKPEFHLSSLSKSDDRETNIFTIFKRKKHSVILFDRSYLNTKHNLRFNITETVITQSGVEIHFDYMNWKYDTVLSIHE